MVALKLAMEEEKCAIHWVLRVADHLNGPA